LADWQQMLSINGFGPFLGMKHVVPYMAKEGKGAVVNISSFTAQIGMGFHRRRILSSIIIAGMENPVSKIQKRDFLIQ